MGEQLSDGGAADRRRAHPHGTASGPPVAGPDLEALLAAAMRPATVDAEGEQRAVAAFRAAREAGAHRARSRRRDDWRPRTRRRTVRSLRATLSLFVASLALGGGAFAAIGTSGSSSDSAGDRATPSSRPAESPSATSGGASPDRPATAADTEAKCRAYDQVGGDGKALESTAWQRLVEAAGGEDKVGAYCAARLADADKGNGKGKADKGKSKGKGKADKGKGKSKGKGKADEGNANSGGTGSGRTKDKVGGKKN
ncbi:hypothetical protein [Streptomyces sp. P17]|uniref:hypothetical protein n=1 Tax=Streptomyces sp. P17 TaxID=3074716 RepID=UPI0028F4428C|nr:hypothetical protein [Streptomyces sp. P17]MDT9700006.1 hypothetical protein [Streptomyces sp. P17]